MAYTTKILVTGSALIQGNATVKDTVVRGALLWHTYQKGVEGGKENRVPFVYFAKDADAAGKAAAWLQDGRRVDIYEAEYQAIPARSAEGYAPPKDNVLLRRFAIVQRAWQTPGFDALRISGDVTLTKDIEVRGSAGTVVSGRIAWNTYRKGVDGGEGNFADFSLFAASEAAAEKMAARLVKGTSLVVTDGELVDSSYTNRNGDAVERRSFVIRNYRIVERAGGASAGGASAAKPAATLVKADFGGAASAPTIDDFMSIGEGGFDEELPFN